MAAQPRALNARQQLPFNCLFAAVGALEALCGSPVAASGLRLIMRRNSNYKCDGAMPQLQFETQPPAHSQTCRPRVWLRRRKQQHCGARVRWHGAQQVSRLRSRATRLVVSLALRCRHDGYESDITGQRKPQTAPLLQTSRIKRRSQTASLLHGKPGAARATRGLDTIWNAD